MKLEYKIEPILFHLKHIKRMCLDNRDCTGCPFNLSNEYCMFSGYQFDEGVIPEDWNIDELEADIMYVDTDSIKIKKEGDKDGC